MSHQDRNLRRNISGFVAAYVLALSLIAVMVTASHFIAGSITSAETDTANEVDVAGAQRMLSQRIALLLTELDRTDSPETTLAELRAARDMFRASHLALINGDPSLRLAGVSTDELGAIYFSPPHEVDRQVMDLILAADKALLRGGALSRAELANVTAQAKGPLLVGLDAVVKRKEVEAREGLLFIERISQWLLVATLVVLAAEALLIFQPLSRHAKRAADDVLATTEELRHSMRHDQLTGLPNRRYSREFLDMALSQANRHGHRVGLFQLDLVGFRHLNDTRGDAVGDLVLQRVAGLVRCETRKGDFVARIGADEFGVICSHVKDLEELQTLADRLSDLIAEPFEIEGVKCDLRCAAAIAMSEEGEVDPLRLLKDVDIALNVAKKQGAVASVLFTPDLRDAFEAKEGLRRELKIALDEGQIEPFFQPQINARTGELDGFEALARWRHPEKGVLSPFVFLNAAAEFGLADRLDEMILDKSLTALTEWRRRGLNVPRVGVNFSAEQLRDPFMAEKIKWAVDAYHLDPSDVCIEILESVLVEEEGDDIAKNIASLSRTGFHIDLDDFGTGHASIATLQRFRVDRIKVDRSFVTAIDTDEEQQKVAGAMIDLAHSLGVVALAEGVETDAEYDQLTRMGCDFLQGFGIGKPMSFDAAPEWLKNYVARGEELKATG